MAQPIPSTSAGGPANWEGAGTLHSYCYDYMRKRGWNETARSFARDAGINEDEWTGPPIEAPQGLLYEWWSVFWDVFIARSQKTGNLNVQAGIYVDAMRAKREPLTIHMPGQQSILLPRSHAHPPPPGYGPRPPPPLHAPQQQQQAAAQHMQQHQQQQAQAMARPPYPSAQYQPGGGPPPPPPGQGYPPPGYSTQSPAPYGNGVPLVRAPGFAESMSAVGLGGRDPNQLSDQEINAVREHMRRTGALPGGQPPTPSQGYRGIPPAPQPGGPPNQHGRLVSGPPPRVHPDQQRLQAQQNAAQQAQMQGMSPQQNYQHQQMLQQREQAQREQYLHRERMVQQQQQQQQQQQHRPPPPGHNGAHLQYPPSQVGSPASPVYSAPRYSQPHHPMPGSIAPSQQQPSSSQPQSSQPQQNSPPAFSPPMLRANAGGTKSRAASAKMSPANSKRGNTEDPSPRSRKKPKPSASGSSAPQGKDADAGNGDGGPQPETPRFDISETSSPSGLAGAGAGGPGMALGPPPSNQPGGQPYRPSASPLPQDPSTRGAMEALQTARMMGQQQQQQHQQHMQQQQYGGNPLTNGHVGNGGTGSRPSSSASNYLVPSNGGNGSFSSDHQLGGGPPPQHAPSPSQNGSGGGGIPPGGFHIPMPPPMGAAAFQHLNGTDMTPGGSRPFAPQDLQPPTEGGFADSSSASGGSQHQQHLQLGHDGHGGQAPNGVMDVSASTAPFDFTTVDDWGVELGPLDDFAFDTFLNESAFKEDVTA